MLSAYLTLFLVIVYYLFDHQVTTNLVDRRFIDLVTPTKWNNSSSASKKWTDALEGAVLMYSDTQVITGLAILLAGYVQLPSGISVYHWLIVVVDLAWFSSLSHLTTLTALRGYFRKRRTMAIHRAIVMGIVLFLLGTAFGPTGCISQTTASSIPAKCFFFIYPCQFWLAGIKSLVG